MKTTDNSKCCRGSGGTGTSDAARKGGKWSGKSGKPGPTTQHRNSTLRDLRKRKENVGPNKDVYANVYSKRHYSKQPKSSSNPDVHQLRNG